MHKVLTTNFDLNKRFTAYCFLMFCAVKHYYYVMTYITLIFWSQKQLKRLNSAFLINNFVTQFIFVVKNFGKMVL